jgi:hypothetical protein
MVLKYLRPGLAASLVLAIAALLTNGAPAAAGDHLVAGADGLFGNYYAQPGMMAAMYPAPLPTPPLAGHTSITYQPLAPHEFLYDHARTYVAHQPGSGLNMTHVHWSTRRVPAVVHLLIGPRGPLHTNNNF